MYKYILNIKFYIQEGTKVFDMLNFDKKTIGLRQSIKAIENDFAKIVLVARDVDETIARRIKELCAVRSVEIVFVDTMKQLGKASGIDVEAAVVCLLK